MSTDRPACRHCGVRRVSRPRGLCWGCYYRPGVRGRYGCADPRTAKYARRGLHPDKNFRGKTPAPTRADPGTPEKVAVLAARAAAGEQLFHEDDPHLAGRAPPRVLVVRDPFPWLTRAGDAAPGRAYPTAYPGGGGDRTGFLRL